MKTKIAVFDFDGTLYPFETFGFLVNQLKNQPMFRSKYYRFHLNFIGPYFLYKLKMMDKTKMRELALLCYIKMFKGLTANQIDQFFDTAYLDMKGKMNETVLQELLQAKADGYKIIVVSGAVKHLLDRVNKDIPFDIVIGSQIPIKDNKYDSNAKLEYIYGDLKVESVKKALKDDDIDWKNSVAYADSGSDLPILRTVGNPVCVAPDDELLAVAQKHNWRIIN